MNCNDNLTINQVKAKKANIIVNKGDNFTAIPFKFWSDIARTMPIDITGSTFKMVVYTGTSVKLELNMAITAPNIVTASTGKIILPQGTYSFDLKETDINGSVTTYIYGDFIVANK